MRNLSHLRRLRFMTQSELAAAVGVTLKTVSAWERGEALPRAQHLRKLCDVLQVEPQELWAAPPDWGKAAAASRVEAQRGGLTLPGMLAHAPAAAV